jgi:hypothetical protein
MKITKRHLITSIFVITLVVINYIRFVDLFHRGYTFDMATIYSWAQGVYTLGLIPFWSYTFGFMDYLPLSVAIFGLLNSVSALLGDNLVSFALVVKLSNWVYDIATVIGLLLISKKVNGRYNTWPFLFYILPCFWFITSTWGQLEGLVIALITWSFYFSLCKEKRYLIYASTLFLAAYHFKLSALLFTPLYLHLLLHNSINIHAYIKRYKNIAALLALSLVLMQIFYTYLYVTHRYTYLAYVLFFTLLSAIALYVAHIKKYILDTVLLKHLVIFASLVLIFGVTAPIRFNENYFQVLISSGGGYGNINIWNIMANIKTQINPNTYAVIALSIKLLVASFFLYTAVLLYKATYIKALSLQNNVLASGILAHVYYVFSSGRMHSRYFIFAVFIYLLYLVIQPKKPISQIVVFISCALLCFINNALVYTHGSQNTSPLWVYTFVNSITVQNPILVLSVINTLFVTYQMHVLIRLLKKKLYKKVV